MKEAPQMRFSLLIVSGLALITGGFVLGMMYTAIEVPEVKLEPNAVDKFDLILCRKLQNLEVKMEALNAETQRLIRESARNADFAPTPSREHGSVADGSPSSGPVRDARERPPQSRTESSVARLKRLTAWNDDATLRGEWIDRPAGDFKKWFGLPDQMAIAQHGATWLYVLRDGGVESRYTVSLQDDRIRGIELATNKF